MILSCSDAAACSGREQLNLVHWQDLQSGKGQMCVFLLNLWHSAAISIKISSAAPGIIALVQAFNHMP